MTEEENTYEIVLKSGRKFKVRPLPKHFFIYYGELPSSMLNEVVEAAKSGNEKDFVNKLTESVSAEDINRLLIFTREAVNCFCVNPKITLSPRRKNEISPFELTDAEFAELSVLAMKSVGGLAEGLNSFRPQSD